MPNKKYPTKVIFVLADMVRQEIGGKHTIIGAYAGDKLLLNSEALGIIKSGNAVVLPTLALYVIFKDGEGDFSLSMQVKRPTGEDQTLPATFDVSKPINSALTFIGDIGPFTVAAEGEYKVTCRLDEQEYRYSFWVASAES